MLTGQPFVVSYGMGVDSTAMLIALHERAIRPDLILFADTGGEKPETYAYQPVIDAWLVGVGFPPITTVRYRPVRAPYTTLEGKCLANETLPSLAYGGHSCSLVFKAEPQLKYLKTWAPALAAWQAGLPVLRAIGYDCSPADRKRRVRADRHLEKTNNEGGRYANCYPLQDWTYPLQEWGLDRVGCLTLIARAGLPAPMKSACFYCPASKKSEVVWLRERHPDLYERALLVESRARAGRHGFGTVKGLGRRFAWSELPEQLGESPEDDDTLRP